MPSLEQKVANLSSNPPLLRMLFYGSPKTKKTWLAGTAAEAGFNTILLDSDHGYHILLKNLSNAAKKRLMVIESRDELKKATAAEFTTRFLKLGNVTFNEQTRKVVLNAKAIDENCIQLNVDRHLNKNTVLIVDSYTALVRSIVFRYAIEQKIDLTDPSKTDWDGYAWCGSLASWMLEKLSKLPCHIIVIGHKTVYEKRAKDQKTIEWTRQQIKSTSGPHSMTIGDMFSDILYFENVSSSMTKISTRADKDMEGGSRMIPPNIYDWNKLQFKDICAFAGINLPPESLPYLDFSVPKQTEGDKKESEQKAVIKSNAGLTQIAGLLKK